MTARPRPPTTPGWWSRWGATVRVVPGEPRNIKVTTAADLEVARALAAS